MSAILRPQFRSSGIAASATQKGKLEEGTWFAGSAEAIGDRNLKARHWQVIAALWFHANPEGDCWPSQETICRMTTLSRKTVGETIKDLTKFGYLKRVRKQRRKSGRFPSNTYKIIRRKLKTR